MAAISFLNAELTLGPQDYLFLAGDENNTFSISLVNKGKRKPLRLQNITQAQFDALILQHKKVVSKRQEAAAAREIALAQYQIASESELLCAEFGL
jgi:hypothetical protein